MWTRKRDGEVEFNINITMSDIRHLAETANVSTLTDDECYEVADELESRFVDYTYDIIGEVIYDLFGDREDDE